MQLATARAPQPRSEKGRLAGRPSHNLSVHNSTNLDTTSSLRLQSLFALGIAGSRANLLAALAWDNGGERLGGAE